MTRIKQDRTRRSGHAHAKNSQDYPQTIYTPAQKRHYLRAAASQFVAMIWTWGEGTLLEAKALGAAQRLIEELTDEQQKEAKQ